MKLIIPFLTLVIANTLSFGQGITKTIISTDFENTPSFIKINNLSNNSWEIGQPNKGSFKNAHSGSRVIVTDSINPYPTNTNSTFEFTFKVTKYEANYTDLSLWHYYDIAPSDSGKIEVSYDGGDNWNNIVTDTNYMIWHYSALPLITGKSTTWELLQFHWTWFIPVKLAHNSSYKICNPPDSIIVRFNFFSGNNNTNQDGWMIDDITVTETSGIGAVQNSALIENNFNVYPNPTNDLITIFSNSINYGSIVKVLNSQGSEIHKSVLEETSNTFSFDLAGKEKGIYFIQLIDKNGQVFAQKVILE